MCSIVASANADKLNDLIELNLYRGYHRYSLLKTGGDFSVSSSGHGRMPRYYATDRYTVVHHQAPTQAESGEQPAWVGNNCLFHNGIIKDRAIKELSAQLGVPSTWDTQLLAEIAARKDWDLLKDIDGSFACVALVQDELYIFRNELAPLFYRNGDISSTKVDGMESLTPNVVFKIEQPSMLLTPVATFNTFDTVYYFGD